MSESLASQSRIQPTAGPPTVIIEPSHGWASFHLRELWEYRELVYFLVWRDVKVRYKQTVLGISWAILQPFLMMVVFSILFGYLAKMPSDEIPYSVFAYAALLPWQLFARALVDSGYSLVANQQLITKVYFPRLIIPIAAALNGLVDFGVGSLILLGIMFYFGIAPSLAVLALPLFLLLAIATALGVGLWLSALNVQYRDVQHIIPSLTQFWLFVTPVAYPSSLLPEAWRAWYGLNPMVGVVEGFRWALLGKPDLPELTLVVSSLATVTLLLTGLLYFRHTERNFADVV